MIRCSNNRDGCYQKAGICFCHQISIYGALKIVMKRLSVLAVHICMMIVWMQSMRHPHAEGLLDKL